MPEPRTRTGFGVLAALLVLASGCSGTTTTAPVADPVTSAAPTPSPLSPTSETPTPSSVAPSTPDPTSATPTALASSSASAPLSPTPPPTPRPTASSTAPTAPRTSTYAQSVSLRGTEVSYTRLRWYWGKAAKARCKAEHITSEFEWCNDYYYENTHQKGQSPLATDARIRLLDDDGTLHDGTSAELATSIRTGTWSYYRLWSAGGRIVKVEQVFTP